MVIVESTHELEGFLQQWEALPSYVIPIWVDLEKHPMNNSLAFLFISFDSGDYIIPFNHTDCICITEVDLSNSTTPKVVWNKKGLLQTNLHIKNMQDLQTKLFFGNNVAYPLDDKLDVLRGFYNRNGVRDDLGKIIPIMKFIEVLAEVSREIKNLPKRDIIGKNWIDTEVIPTLAEVEKMGLRIHTEKYFDRWDALYHTKHLVGDIIYTEYNPYTITSRPSNRHGGINFAALNKDDGTRDVFIPREGNVFLQLDYDAYHVRIMAEFIDFHIPEISGHSWLAKQYGIGYAESKGRTFRNIYGGVIDKHIPFFNEIDKFIQLFWDNTQKTGLIQTTKRRIPLEYVDEPNPQKVFNYLLQSMETEINIGILKKLIDAGFTPVLYSYDSFLFDIPPNKELMREIKNITDSKGFPSKISIGRNYGEL